MKKNKVSFTNVVDENITLSNWMVEAIPTTFLVNEEGIAIFDESKYDEKPLFKEIFEACGIDPQRMADGLTAYITQKGEASDWESSTDVDLVKIKNWPNYFF